MDAEIVHSGFDGLKFTIQIDIPPEFRNELASAKEHAKKTMAIAWWTLLMFCLA